MNTLTIENKEYVIIPKKEYEALLKTATTKAPPAKILSLKEGRKLECELIDKWAKEK